MPLAASGLGIDILAQTNRAAIASMSSAVAALHRLSLDLSSAQGLLELRSYELLYYESVLASYCSTAV